MSEELSCYLNGQFVPLSQATISFADRGVRWGDAVFETERTFEGRLFRLREHLERLFRSLAAVRIDPGMTLEEMAQITEEVVQRNDSHRSEAGDFWVTQTVTRGTGWIASEKVEPTICIRAYPLKFSYYADYYTSGCRIVLARTRTYPSASLDPRIKHISRLNFVLAELEAQDVDPGSYPVLLDVDGNIAEYSAGNIFVVSGGVVRTPTDSHALAGISRATVIELARDLGIRVSVEDLQPYDVYTADEVFLTTTSFCVLPVTQVDKRPVNSGAPGPITLALLDAWSRMVDVDIVAQAQEGTGV